MAQILVVEKDESVRDYIRSALTLSGHSVREARNGPQALAAFRVSVPDLVVCDLFMPRAEGLETLCALRWLAPKLPIIALSCGVPWGAMETLHEAVALGANIGLTKPFGPRELFRAVDSLLGTVSVPRGYAPVL